jgi:hypothetical protein
MLRQAGEQQRQLINAEGDQLSQREIVLRRLNVRFGR